MLKNSVPPWTTPEVEARRQELKEIMSPGLEPDASREARVAALEAIKGLRQLEREYPTPTSIIALHKGGVRVKFRRGSGRKAETFK